MSWIDNFDERQQKEIEFCRLYARRFAHGTDGHNARIIIARMARLLDEIYGLVGQEMFREVQCLPSQSEETLRKIAALSLIPNEETAGL